MFLRHRVRLPELMDQPGLDRHAHVHALHSLERINRWSRSSRILWPAIRALAREQPNRPVRLLDIATGAGDVPIRLCQLARQENIALEVAACDISDEALKHARGRAAAGASIEFFRLDVVHESLPTGYDVLVSSLFLHHLDDGDARSLFRRMGEAAGRLILVNDLRRSVVGLLMARIGTQLLSRSHVVHVDGPISVKAAFTITEAQRLAEEAGLSNATVRSRWPCRFLLQWRRP
jgi:SAM-dependent methyltransferase